MIKFFRKIRYDLIEKNKTGKYLKYAVGEIILVVIGILIALQINNWNEARKIRNKEIVFLNSIKNDLQLSIIEIEDFISTRKSQIKSANLIMEYYNGKPVNDWNLFNRHIVSIYTWQSFYLIDNTYQELKNSGSFVIISNDSIKNELLNLELLYKKLKYSEDHWKYDAQNTLYPGSYQKQDINSMSKNYIYQVSNGQSGEFGNLTEATFGKMLQDQQQKNGFAFASMDFAGMNGILSKMNTKCKKLISQIDKEMATE